MKYKIGYKVRVKYGLVVGQKYGALIATGGMLENRGNVFTIDGAIINRTYTVKENAYFWSEEMLEPVGRKTKMMHKVGEKARVRKDLDMDKSYGGWLPKPQLFGKIITIKSVYSDRYAAVEGGEWWTDEMLEPVAQEQPEVGDTVTVQLTGVVKTVLNSDGRFGFHVDGMVLNTVAKPEHIIKIEKKQKMARLTLDFDMPKNCQACDVSAGECARARGVKFLDEESFGEIPENSYFPKDKRRDDCPLKEIES